MAARRARRLLVTFGFVVGSGLLLAASTQGARKGVAVTEGKLTQLAGTAGCVSETGTSGQCVDGKALDDPEGAATSPDGRHVYVVSAVSSAVSVFGRNQATGALTQLAGTDGCVSETGTAGQCVDGKGLSGAQYVAVSPDGRNVYVTANGSNAVAVFARNETTGALTQLSGTAGCVSEDGTGGLCTDGKALNGALGVVVSPDGEHVYVMGLFGDAVAAFDRDPATGALTQLSGTAGCVSETGTGGQCADGKALVGASFGAFSPGGEHLYVSAQTSSAVVAFSRNASTGQLTQLSGTAGCLSEDGTGGQCTDGRALPAALGISIAPDGAHVYAASIGSNAVAILTRNGGTGALTQAADATGCVSENAAPTCTDGNAIVSPWDAQPSPDGRFVYVAGQGSSAIAAFSRNAATGALTQLAGADGCIQETGASGCADGKALAQPENFVVSPDGANVYLPSQSSDSVAVFSRQRVGTRCHRAGSMLAVFADLEDVAFTRPGGDAINVAAASIVDSTCGGSTVLNTDTIDVDGATGTESVTIDISGGSYAPGLTDEPGTTDEIEWSIDPIGELTIEGSAVADTIRLGSSGINLSGDGDADIVPATPIALVTVNAGAGNDLVTGVGAFGADPGWWMSPVHMNGEAGADKLTGGLSDDEIDGGSENDTLSALKILDGADLFVGGLGVDTVSYSTRTAALSITLDDIANDGAAGEGDDVRVENVIGGKNNDNIDGGPTSMKNTLRGGPGLDDLFGGPGADNLRGDAGADDLFGQAGKDTLNGQDGVGGNDTLDGGSEFDTCKVDAGDSTLNCEA